MLCHFLFEILSFKYHMTCLSPKMLQDFLRQGLNTCYSSWLARSSLALLLGQVSIQLFSFHTDFL